MKRLECNGWNDVGKGARCVQKRLGVMAGDGLAAAAAVVAAAVAASNM